jgi:uncharacterized protein YjiS (DUF1127 family)
MAMKIIADIGITRAGAKEIIESREQRELVTHLVIKN